MSTKLLLKGGSARAIIPFVKKMGLVSSDGTPTDRYKEFRNPDKSGFAIADAMRELYEPLFGMNEYIYDLDTAKLKGLIVEATGAESNSTVVQKTLSTFQALKKRADFEGDKTIVDDMPLSDYTENLKPSFPIIAPYIDPFNTIAMPDYRRVWHRAVHISLRLICCSGRGSDLLTRHIDLLREAVKMTQRHHPFIIHAWIVLPDYLHCIIELPPNDADFAIRWRLIKITFSKALPITERRSRVRMGER